MDNKDLKNVSVTVELGMYHRNESRIRGHILVCFLALVLESYLAYKLKGPGAGKA